VQGSIPNRSPISQRSPSIKSHINMQHPQHKRDPPKPPNPLIRNPIHLSQRNHQHRIRNIHVNSAVTHNSALGSGEHCRRNFVGREQPGGVGPAYRDPKFAGRTSHFISTPDPPGTSRLHSSHSSTPSPSPGFPELRPNCVQHEPNHHLCH